MRDKHRIERSKALITDENVQMQHTNLSNLRTRGTYFAVLRTNENHLKNELPAEFIN